MLCALLFLAACSDSSSSDSDSSSGGNSLLASPKSVLENLDINASNVSVYDTGSRAARAIDNLKAYRLTDDGKDGLYCEALSLNFLYLFHNDVAPRCGKLAFDEPITTLGTFTDNDGVSFTFYKFEVKKTSSSTADIFAKFSYNNGQTTEKVVASISVNDYGEFDCYLYDDMGSDEFVFSYIKKTAAGKIFYDWHPHGMVYTVVTPSETIEGVKTDTHNNSTALGYVYFNASKQGCVIDDGDAEKYLDEDGQEISLSDSVKAALKSGAQSAKTKYASKTSAVESYSTYQSKLDAWN